MNVQILVKKLARYTSADFLTPRSCVCSHTNILHYNLFLGNIHFFRDAFSLVQQRRFCINPNEGFMAQLKEFEPIYKAQRTLQNGQCSTEKGQNKRRIDQVDDQLSGQAEILVSEAMDMTGSWYAPSWYVFGLMVLLLSKYWYKFCVSRLGDLDAGNMVTLLRKHTFVTIFADFFF